jgi:hypothetical protein
LLLLWFFIYFFFFVLHGKVGDQSGLANKMNLKKKKLAQQKIVFSLIAEIIKSKFNV